MAPSGAVATSKCNFFYNSVTDGVGVLHRTTLQQQSAPTIPDPIPPDGGTGLVIRKEPLRADTGQLGRQMLRYYKIYDSKRPARLLETGSKPSLSRARLFGMCFIAKALGKGGVPSLLPQRKASGCRELVYAPVRGLRLARNVTFYDSCILAM